MFRRSILALAVMTLIAFQAKANPVVLVVRSAMIEETKTSGCCWDFAPGKKAWPDPYLKAWVFDTDGAHVDYGETHVAWDTLLPVWDRDFVKVRAGQKIRLEAWDKDLKYDDLIGEQTFTVTDAMIKRGSFTCKFGQVSYLRFDVRAETPTVSEPRVVLQQPFPGPNSASKLARTPDRKRAVVLLHGLDLRDDGRCAATPRFVDWQSSTSPLVKCLSKEADVFAISYAQTTPIEEIASFPELREAIGKVKKLGYNEVVLLGHSAGGLLARHFVEEHPRAGITRVIQVATPNTGAKLAGWAVKLMQVPKAQTAFVDSLSPAHRAAVLKNRAHRTIPADIDFVTVVTSTSSKANGDKAITRECQWSDDLRSQGIPCVCVEGTHMDVMADDTCLGIYCKLATEPQPRTSGGYASR